MTGPAFVLDPATLTARAGAREARLNRREFAVLAALAAEAGATVAHRRLLAPWGPHADLANLRVAIRSLRRKLEPDPELPSLIVTEPGVGYRLARPDRG